MPHPTAALHELNLLLVNLDDATVGVRLTVQADDKAVAERAHLKVVADAGHGAALWHNVTEMAHELENSVLAHGIGILLLDASNLAGNAVVHVVGSELVDVAIRVFQRILAGPDTSCQLVALKVLECSVIHLLISVSSLVVHFYD